MSDNAKEEAMEITRRIFNGMICAAALFRSAPKTPRPKVYEMNDCDWVAALSREQAIDWYIEETGLLPCDVQDVEEIGPEGMLNLTRVDDLEKPHDEWIKRSFMEALDLDMVDIAAGRQPVPYIFASTEW